MKRILSNLLCRLGIHDLIPTIPGAALECANCPHVDD